MSKTTVAQTALERMEFNVREILSIVRKARDGEVFKQSEEAANLRTALNNLVGAIINKKIEGLEEDLEEARAMLRVKHE